MIFLYYVDELFFYLTIFEFFLQAPEPVSEPPPPIKKVKHDNAEPLLVVPVFIVALRDAVIQEGEKFTFQCKYVLIIGQALEKLKKLKAILNFRVRTWSIELLMNKFQYLQYHFF